MMEYGDEERKLSEVFPEELCPNLWEMLRESIREEQKEDKNTELAAREHKS